MSLTSSTPSHSSTDENLPLSEEQDADIHLPSDLDIASIPLIKVRVLNHRPFTEIRRLKSNFYNQFVSVVGTVVRVGVSKLLVTQLAFECEKCNRIFVR